MAVYRHPTITADSLTITFNTSARSGMEYEKFVQQLSKGMEGKIVAFDNNPEEEGCVIYLHTRDHAIFVPRELIEQYHDEAVRVIRERIAQGLFEARLLVLVLLDGELALT